MVKRKITWSARARIELYNIMEFYRRRNGNLNYSKKIYSRIRKGISTLKHFPQIGSKTDFSGLRKLSVGRFNIYYRIKKELVEIAGIWDTQQNPNNLKPK